MGLVIGMILEKRVEILGVEKVVGLSQIYKMGSLFEVVDVVRLKVILVDSELADDEFINLNWFYESINFLINFSFGSEGFFSVILLYDIEGDDVLFLGLFCYQNLEKKLVILKFLYFFSFFIYMVIEYFLNKCLFVKEIYNWILDRFLYFVIVLIGWKNFVRYNLFLNKCFQKVERSYGKVSVYENCYVWGGGRELICRF